MGSSPTTYVDAPGARLAVYDEGPAADPVVLLHGGPGVPDYLGDVSALLSPMHHVIRFDQRGTGHSGRSVERYGLNDYVEDLESVRRAFGIDRLALFGHSWGGTLAQLYAAHYPERVARLCLCDSGIGLGADWKVMERAVMAHNRRRGGIGGFALLGLDQLIAMLPGAAGDRGARRMMARVWRNYFESPRDAPAPSPEWLAGVHSRPIFATRRSAIEADAAELQGTEVDSAAEVLIIFGEHDIYGDTTELLLSRYPSARSVVIPGAGHLPWLQNRPVFAKELESFFATGSGLTKEST